MAGRGTGSDYSACPCGSDPKCPRRSIHSRGWYAGEHTSMRTLTPAQVQAATEDGGFKLMLA